MGRQNRRAMRQRVWRCVVSATIHAKLVDSRRTLVRQIDGVVAGAARRLKILVSVVRFRPGPPRISLTKTPILANRRFCLWTRSPRVRSISGTSPHHAHAAPTNGIVQAPSVASAAWLGCFDPRFLVSTRTGSWPVYDELSRLGKAGVMRESLTFDDSVPPCHDNAPLASAWSIYATAAPAEYRVRGRNLRMDHGIADGCFP
jgi:hypothetical protein